MLRLRSAQVSNCGLRGTIMGRGLINSLEIKSKSAFRNLKSAILLCAMLFALCAVAEAQQPEKVYHIGYLANSPGIGSSEEILR
jgi:hypothetical protein